MGQEALDSLYDGRANHQRLAIDMLADLTPDQLALRPSTDSWSVWQPAGHVAGARSWVVWHLIEHDVHHTGEMSIILGSHGVPGLDL